MSRLGIILLALTLSLSIGCKSQGNFFWSHTGSTPIAEIKYGYQYNWYAANNVNNIANIGWHMPTESNWITLRNYLDPVESDPTLNTAGGHMKETGLIYWDSPNTGASNSSNFNARGASFRSNVDGGFGNLGQDCLMWNPRSSSSFGGAVNLVYNDDYLQTSVGSTAPKAQGRSVRLIKDSTTLSDGETGTYTGNDGTIYRTICIGTQEWLADNLAETKYRNGDWITGFDGGTYTPISNVNWAAKTTEAMCVYDDDLDNK